LFLVHNLNDKTFFTINGSFWSLALEMQLYLLYPLFLFIRKKLGVNKTTLFVLSLFFLSIIFKIIIDFKSLPFETSAPRLWIIWVIGALYGEYYFLGKRVFQFKGYHIVLLLILIIPFRFTILYRYFSPLYFALFYAIFAEWFLNYSIGHFNTFINKIYGFIKFIGTCSYSMYLLHQPLLKIFYTYFSSWIDSRNSLSLKVINISFTFLVIVLISFLSFLFVEKPSIVYGKLFYKKYLQPNRLIVANERNQILEKVNE
jgi:peptidoglycan/LPS O-acetylase OafA/YrhL